MQSPGALGLGPVPYEALELLSVFRKMLAESTK
jgi:hypothetical protein